MLNIVKTAFWSEKKLVKFIQVANRLGGRYRSRLYVHIKVLRRDVDVTVV